MSIREIAGALDCWEPSEWNTSIECNRNVDDDSRRKIIIFEKLRINAVNRFLVELPVVISRETLFHGESVTDRFITDKISLSAERRGSPYSGRMTSD